jgi:hypothetical protein
MIKEFLDLLHTLAIFLNSIFSKNNLYIISFCSCFSFLYFLYFFPLLNPTFIVSNLVSNL